MTYPAKQFARVLEGTMQDARLRWWSAEVDAFGRRVDEHSARIDGAIARVDAALDDYRRIG